MAAPRRRIGQDMRRAELLAAAERLLQRDGTAVRVEDIVAAARAAKGTFYTCFATWDDMLDEVRARKIAELERSLAPVLKKAGPQLLANFATTAVDFIVGMGGLHEVLFHSAFTLARPLPAHERPPARIAQLLRAGQNAGIYAPCDAEPMAVLIFAVIHETADAIAAGADRKRSLATLKLALERMVAAGDANQPRNPRDRP